MTITKEQKEFINSLLQMDDEELIKLVIPPGELHSPETDKFRLRDMCLQCMKKYKNQIAEIYIEHSRSTQLALDLCASLLPILSPSKMYGETALIVFIVVLARHGLSYIGIK